MISENAEREIIGKGTDLAIGAMRVSIDEGTHDVLELMLAHMAPRIERTGNNIALHELKIIREKYACARALEKVHGSGCLLRLEKPELQEKIRRGWVPPHYVENARRYQAAISTHAQLCSVPKHHSPE